MDEKEKLLLEEYKYKFSNNSFIEYDIYGFLILIRNYIRQHKSTYPYIIEFCDLIAHRKRDRGLIMDAISAAIESKYKTKISGKIALVNGIDEENWLKEWKKISQNLKLNLTERNIDEITMCIFSLAHGTIYNNFKNKAVKPGHKHRGTVKIFQDDNHNSYIGVSANRKDSKFFAFAKYPCKIKNFNDMKYNGGLLIRDKDNNLIIKGSD